MITLEQYLILGAILFSIGIVGVLTRRNVIIIFMSIELMFNAVNITLISFSHFLHDLDGQVLAMFIIAVAAAEAAIGLGIVVSIFRRKETVNVDEINLMKW